MPLETTNRELLTRAEAGDYLRLAPKTLAKWAWAGQGPAYYRAGGRVVYEKSELDRWLNGQRCGGAEPT